MQPHRTSLIHCCLSLNRMNIVWPFIHLSSADAWIFTNARGDRIEGTLISFVIYIDGLYFKTGWNSTIPKFKRPSRFSQCCYADVCF